MRRTDNQSIFDTGNWASKMARCLGFSVSPFRGVFRTPGAHPAPAAKRHIHSLRPLRLIFTGSINFSAWRCERIRTLNLLRAEGLATFPFASRPPDSWSGVLRLKCGTAGG